MKYETPQLVVLGNASELIESCNKGDCVGDGSSGSRPSISAYELDE